MNHRRSLTAVVGACLLTAVAFSAARRSDTPTTPTPTTGEGQSAALNLTTTTQRPRPEEAAADAIRLTGDIIRAGFISRKDIIESIASARFADDLSSRSAAQLADMTATVGGAGIAPADLVCEELPLKVHVVNETATTATVQVWSLLIVGAASHGAPRQAWRTVTIDLVWERDDWRIDGWETAAGPTPALTPTAPISDVASVATVLAWSASGGER